MPAQAAREHVRRLVQEAAATTAREHVKAHAAELAADVLALALALAPPHAQEAAATIAQAVVATLALAHAKTLPPPLAHHVATVATVLAARVAQAAVVVAALLPAPEPLKAMAEVPVAISVRPHAFSIARSTVEQGLALHIVTIYARQHALAIVAVRPMDLVVFHAPRRAMVVIPVA